MFNINEFLNYATDGQTSTPATKSRKAPSVSVRTNNKTVTLTTFKTEKVLLPSGPIMVHTYQAPAAPVMAAQPTKPALELVNYSDRSFAIFGDTKPMQARLEALGGKFNRWLKKDGIVTPGYIFSIGRIESVRKALSL